MTSKTKIILASVSLLTAFAFGRWSAPEYVKTDKETTENSDTTKKKKKTTTEKENPDGSKEKTVTEEEETSKSKSKTDAESEEVRAGSSKVTISVLAGTSVFDDSSIGSNIRYGVSISRPILGPITVGAFYLTPGIVGASIGLTF